MLTQYKTIAKQRIATIERLPELDVDCFLEKGILLSKVFMKKEEALKSFKAALQQPGGDLFLLLTAARVIDDTTIATELKNRFQDLELANRKQQLNSKSF